MSNRPSHIPIHIPSNKDTKIGPFGRCIYCGATDGLTDEHPVPEYLGGRLKLLDASCKRCATITSGVESKCANEQFPSALAFLKMRKKKARRLRGKFPVLLLINCKLEVRYVSGEDHLPTLRLNSFALPGASFSSMRDDLVVTNRLVWTLTRGRPETRGGPDPWQAKARNLMRKTGASRIGFEDRFDDRQFARMVAKIGYGFAVAILGLGSFRPLVVRPILQPELAIGLLVGGVEKPDPLPPGVDIKNLNYFVGLSCTDHPVSGRPILWAHVRLFAWFGNTPEYVVLLGVPTDAVRRLFPPF